MKFASSSEPGSGYILLFNDLSATWGHICADNWNLINNDVICKQMGFSAGSGKQHHKNLHGHWVERFLLHGID